jgi:hypothetical protein
MMHASAPRLTYENPDRELRVTIETWARPRWQYTSGYPVPEKKKEGLARVLRVQTLSEHGAIHGSERKKGRTRKENGWHEHYGLPA